MTLFHNQNGFCSRKSGRTKLAINMLEKCIWLQPKFVQAHVELLSLKTEVEKEEILKKLVELEPGNWEHFVLYGDWFKTKGKQRLLLFVVGL